MSVRWGLIGAGDIAKKRIAPALKSGAGSVLLAVSRADPDRLQVFADEFGIQRSYANWQDLVRDDEIDAVYIATPVFLHAEQTIAAAEAGKHVLCEKPMALNVDECDRMIAACSANGVELGVAYYRHFYPVIARIQEIISSGEIGKVSVAQINAFERFEPESDDPRRWLIDKQKSGGGPMMDFGCHRIEVLMNLFGEIESTSAIVSSEVLNRDVEDTAVANLKFRNGPLTTITVTHASHRTFDTLDIYGTNGSIRMLSLNSGELVVEAGDAVRVEVLPPDGNLHQPLVDDFVSALANGSEPVVNGQLGRGVSEIVAAVYGSGR